MTKLIGILKWTGETLHRELYTNKNAEMRKNSFPKGGTHPLVIPSNQL